ncbi:MAG TPA: radical SAM protein [Candidatus Polarisedimenticolia bacterium]|nr:radical SAM protein [Candidatus Polarisedimenticolia bacterium]
MSPSTPAGAADRHPGAPLLALDTLWLQVAGTLCNLQCSHCFISCSPVNHSHAMMTLVSLRPLLEEAASLGVKEYYLTGGEPFLNPEILPILEAVLSQGPATVLTNGLLLRPGTAASLRGLSEATPYSLDLRISLDGWDAAGNDPIRGEGTFDRIVSGIRNLAKEGLAPVLTVTEACGEAGSRDGRLRFLHLMRTIGLPHPRLKIMPLLRIGAETSRTRAYLQAESLRGHALTASEAETLACTTGRMATSRGIFTCPILIEEPAARMGRTLGEALAPVTLRHAACWTCVAEGLSCRT